LALIGGGILVGRAVTSSSSSVARTSTTTMSAPPRESGAIRLWLSATTVPVTGASLAVGLVNRTTTSPTFGVEADLERWNGSTWVAHKRVVLCMVDWNCDGAVEDRPGRSLVPAVGLGVDPGSQGVIGRFRTQGLRTGWYRLGMRANSGEAATATFEVRDDVARPGPLPDIRATTQSVGPALLPPTGGRVQTWPILAPGAGLTTIDTYIAATAGLGETATVQRWTGHRWQPVAKLSLTLPLGSPPAGRQPARFALIPPLEPGDYRLLRDAREGAPQVGNFWIRRAY
jgi:hypothetical protein